MLGKRSPDEAWSSPRRIALGAAATSIAVVVVVFAALRNDEVHAWLKAHASHPFDHRDAIDERSAYYLFDLDRIGDSFLYDLVAYLLPGPNHERTWTWPEHPAGRLTRRTNNLGFQEDHVTEREKRGVRILVAGDSHTAGLVANRESFANLVESRLGDEPDWQGLEVINAGVAYTARAPRPRSTRATNSPRSPRSEPSTASSGEWSRARPRASTSTR